MRISSPPDSKRSCPRVEPPRILPCPRRLLVGPGPPPATIARRLLLQLRLEPPDLGSDRPAVGAAAATRGRLLLLKKRPQQVGRGEGDEGEGDDGLERRGHRRETTKDTKHTKGKKAGRGMMNLSCLWRISWGPIRSPGRGRLGRRGGTRARRCRSCRRPGRAATANCWSRGARPRWCSCTAWRRRRRSSASGTPAA